MFLHSDAKLFGEVLAGAAGFLGIHDAIIEKDYYVTLILRILAKNVEEAVFKGGTSLSKCHHVISRFSEDIDIGFVPKLPEGRRRKLKDIIVTNCSDIGFSLANPNEIKSRRDFNRYVFLYPAVCAAVVNQTLAPHVILETFNGASAAPTVRLNVDSYVLQYLTSAEEFEIIKGYELSAFEMQLQDLKRTFADKVFAICDYYMESKPDRNSRHVYDLCKLTKEIRFDDELREVIEAVRTERRAMHKCPSSAEDTDVSRLLTEIVDSNFYRADYEGITKQLLHEELSYKTSAAALTEIAGSGIFSQRG